MTTLLALALLLAPATGGDDFHDRVTQGRLAEAAATGPAYQKTLWAKIGNPMTDTLKGCIARNTPADKSPFTLVADVAADGRPARIFRRRRVHRVHGVSWIALTRRFRSGVVMNLS